MPGPGRIAGHLDDAAAALTTAERDLLSTAADPAAFGADAAGRPGELGRNLHARFSGALAARGREAADAARRLADTADALRAAAGRYADVDDAAADRHRREA